MPQIDLQSFLNNTQPPFREGPSKPALTAEIAEDGVVLDNNGQEVIVYQEKDEEPVNKLPHGPLRMINATKISGRRSMMEQLNKTIILNDLDLPQFIYRSDILDPNFFAVLGEGATQEDGEVAQSMLDASIVVLGYDEGYPTANNQPFWNRLPWESEVCYRAFGLYLDQAGARSISAIIGFPIEDLDAWFHEYNWLMRARSYDMYKIVHHQKQRIGRQIDVETLHYTIASRLISNIESALGRVNWQEIDIEPEKLVKMLDTVSKIQRTSVGLPANGGRDGTEPPQSASVEVIMRQIAPKSAEKRADTDEYDLLTEDPEAIEAAQELIVNINKKRA